MNVKEKFNVSPKKVKALFEKISELGINLSDIEEKITRGGGKGGQKINKTSNRVQLHHVPTGMTVSCQKDRARNINRFLALRDLVDKIEMNLFPRRSIRLREVLRARKQRAKRRKRTRLKLKEKLN